MNLLKLMIAVAVIFVLQTMVLNRYEYFHLMDLFLLLNIYCALNFNQMICMGISIPTGLIQDVYSAKGIIGINAFSKTIIVFFISGLSSRLMIKHPLVILLLIAISTNLDYFIILGLHRLFGLDAFPLSGKTLLTASIINSVIGTIVFQMTDRIRTKKEYA